MSQESQPSDTYREGFFDDAYVQHTSASARVIADVILGLVHPRSVVDVGCGLGLFLAEFGSRGIEDLCGIDGDWVSPKQLRFPAERFVSKDLRESISLDRSFDLALCLEVGEHLPSEAAARLVASLVFLAPVVLFSAAIPRQGGIGHVNEQWPEYWAAHFAKHGYVAIDCIRPRIWNNPEVLWWYAQNAVLYVKQDQLANYPVLAGEYTSADSIPLGRVHPSAFLFYRDAAPAPKPPVTLRQVLGQGKRWALQRFSKPAKQPPRSAKRLNARYV